MDAIIQAVSNGLKYITFIRVSDVVDILIIAFLIYKAFGLISKTNTMRVAKGIIVLLVLLWLSGLLKLSMINFLLRNTFELGFIALVIIFQPELRRLLEKVGSSRVSAFFGNDFKSLDVENAITQTVIACSDMSDKKTGALIIFARDNQLMEPISTGTIINADVTAELLKNIFFVKAPMHDGAVIIKNGRIVSAGCMLPLSTNNNLSRDLGMRHRAGIGMSEQSDAVVLIVSEETGSISVAVDGMLKRHLSPETVETLLRRELIPTDTDKPRRKSLLDIFKVNKDAE
ncbi:MAG: diadenylate cyclase CdaA [Oscillospiraceae bacterium]|nr:diadenylate cyclase CdaA [Oscillospiraceae bacterium]